MEGYDVITSDGEKLGTVVSLAGDNLIVERGKLFKSRHALPLAFVHADHAERAVRTTLSKDLIQESPTVKYGELDERAVAEYYGLEGGEPDPPTEGYGVLNADDPTVSADQQARSEGIVPAEQNRADIRKHLGAGETYGPPGRQIIPPDPHTSDRPGDYDDR